MATIVFEAKTAGYLERIWQLRYFWFSLVRMDLRARYRRSFLGIGWSLLRPLAMSAVLCFVFSKLFNVAISEYGPFLLLGLTVWQFITESIMGGCGCMIHAGPYIRQQPLPLAIFGLRSVLGSGFHGLISLGLAIGFCFALRGLDNPGALVGLLPAIGLLFLVGWAFAVLFGLINAIFTDTHHFLEIALQILFYLTPVLYAPETMRGRERFTWVMDLNPFTYFLELFRQPVLKGQLPTWDYYAVAGGTVLGVGLLAIYFLQRLEKRLVFWL